MHSKGTSIIKATAKQVVTNRTETMFSTSERGAVAATQGLTWSRRYRDRHCALGTLRKGAALGQEEEGQTEEDVALKILRTVTIVIVPKSVFLLSGHLDY